MSKNNYTLSTLQEIEEKAQIEADKLGLYVPETLFHLVQAEEMYDVAARGLPGRYSHYSFGRRYQEEKGNYDKGRGRIYELVINTRPVYAYLLDGNSLVAQMLVIAHVLGHATVFEHNRYFSVADKNILSRTRAAAERIDGYMGEYGRERVENFIDICHSLEMQRPFGQLGKKWTAKVPVWEDKAFDMLFPEETAQRRKDWKEAKEEFRTRFPKQPERDFLAFFEEHARTLEDWQRDVISIIRMENEYFTPQMRTQVLNEAQAVFYHQTIAQKLMADDPEMWDTDAFMEFQSMNASVLHPRIAMMQIDGSPLPKEWEEYGIEPYVFCLDLNPYMTGTAIYHEVKRICEEPTDEDKERWEWAGQISWDEKRAELVKVYDDSTLLAEFLNPRVCEEAKLFVRPRTNAEYADLRVLEDEADKVRELLVERRTGFGVPVVEIVDADYKRRGELLLEHRFTDRGLDDEYTRGVLPHVSELWGHAVTVHTTERDEKPVNLDDFQDNPAKAYMSEPEFTLKDIWFRIEDAQSEVTSHYQEP